MISLHMQLTGGLPLSKLELVVILELLEFLHVASITLKTFVPCYIISLRI
jgi:hypothetical protein